jgi:Zn-dependent alcohol dehydrogenase
MQLGAAGAMSLGAPRLAHAAETAAHGSMMNVTFEKRDPRVAVIGTGGRGTSLLGDLLAADAQIAALCDIVPEKAEHAASLVVAAG